MRIVYTPTIGDYVSAQRAHTWRKYKPRTANLLRVLGPVVGVVILVFAFSFYRDGSNSALILIESLCGVYCLLAGNVLAPFLWRRQFRRTRGLGGEVVLTITAEFLTMDRPGRSAGTIEWGAILGVLDWPDVTLLYISPASFMYFSRRFIDDAQRFELLALCKSKCIPFTYPEVEKNKKAQAS
jgi:hypothetical protein